VGRALAADVEFVLTPGVDGVLSAARASMRERLDRGSAAYLIAEFAYTHQRAIGQPIRRGDALDIENEFSSATAVGLVEEGPSLAVPLRSASCIEGVLYVGRHRQSGHFSSRQAQFVLLVGGLIAQFIERQRLEQAAVQLRALEQADLLKSALVASVSHELRSPLAAVAAAITGLISHADQVDPEYLVSELTSAADDLRTLDGRIGAILDISRLEAASWAPTPEWHDIGDLCQAVRSAVPAAARERVRIALPAQLPPAWFDFVQMGRVLHHIVENALDYSPPTSAVTIGAEVRSSCLALWVEDAGVGIPDSEKSLIFEKFYRGSSGGARTHGTGLGLAIASEIVKQHGGRIELEDVEPQGARFVIQLPMTEGGRCGE
jgi:two-component system sensor histidine kinase KdpD